MATTLRSIGMLKGISKNIGINKIGALVLSAMVCGSLATESLAQSGSRSAPSAPSGFGSTSVNTIISGNSSARFSVNNIQRAIQTRSAPIIGTPGVNRRNFLGSSSSSLNRPSKPFAGVSRGPSVSPYLALSAPRASASDYYNVIRPQQQRQQDNQRQQILALRQQRRLNQLAARGPYSTTGDENSAPTGHVAVFQSLGSYQNTASYFPPPSRPKQQR